MRLFFSFYENTVLLKTRRAVLKQTENVLSVDYDAFILGFYVYLIKYFIIPESQELLVTGLVHMSAQFRDLSLAMDVICLL